MLLNSKELVLYSSDIMSQVYPYLLDQEKVFVFPQVCKTWQNMSYLFGIHCNQIDILSELKKKIKFYNSYIIEEKERKKYWKEAFSRINNFSLISCLRNSSKHEFIENNHYRCVQKNFYYSYPFNAEVNEFSKNLKSFVLKTNCQTYINFSSSIYVRWNRNLSKILIDLTEKKQKIDFYRSIFRLCVKKEFKISSNIEFSKKIKIYLLNSSYIEKASLFGWKNCNTKNAHEKHHSVFSAINLKLQSYILFHAKNNFLILAYHFNKIEQFYKPIIISCNENGSIIEISNKKRTPFSWSLILLNCNGFNHFTWNEENLNRMEEGRFIDFIRWSIITKTINLFSKKFQLMEAKRFIAKEGI